MKDLARVHITRDNIYFNGVAVPRYVADGGVTFIPGGSKDCNRLRIEFLVGTVVSDDPTILPEDFGAPIYEQLMIEAPKPPEPSLWLNENTVCPVCGKTPAGDDLWKMGWDTPGYWVHVACDRPAPDPYVRSLKQIEAMLAMGKNLGW